MKDSSSISGSIACASKFFSLTCLSKFIKFLFWELRSKIIKRKLKLEIDISLPLCLFYCLAPKIFLAAARTLLSSVIYTTGESVGRRRRVSTGGRVPRAVADKPVYVLEIARVGFSPRRSFFARAHRHAAFLRRPDLLFFILFSNRQVEKGVVR